MAKGIRERNEKIMKIAKFRSFINCSVPSPKASASVAFFPFASGGVSGNDRFRNTATKLTPAPQ